MAERAMAPSNGLDVSTLHALVVRGDLSQLTPEQQVRYYLEVCRATGLVPATKPFEFLKLNGRLVLYALKSATDQLRAKHNLSMRITRRERIDDQYLVECEVTDGTRTDQEIGVVSLAGLSGDALANAIMKAVTKAKRRATLSFCGLGMLDETEVESIPSATPAPEATARVIEQIEEQGAEGAASERADTGASEAAERDQLRRRWAQLWNRAMDLRMKPTVTMRPHGSLSDMREAVARLAREVTAMEEMAAERARAGNL